MPFFVFFFRDVSHITNDKDRNLDDHKDSTSNENFSNVVFERKSLFLRVACLIWGIFCCFFYCRDRNGWLSDCKRSPTNGTLDILPDERFIDWIMLIAPGTLDLEFHSLTSSFVLLIANVWGNVRFKWRRSSSIFLTSEHKKAGRIPVRHTCRSRQEPAQETTEIRPARRKDTLVLAGVFRILGQKCLKLGGFTCVFAEITDKMSMESDSRWSGKRFQNTIYTRTEKNQTVFLIFLSFFPFLGRGLRTRCVRASLGAALPPWWPSLALGIRFILPRDAIQLTARRARLKLFR